MMFDYFGTKGREIVDSSTDDEASDKVLFVTAPEGMDTYKSCYEDIFAAELAEGAEKSTDVMTREFVQEGGYEFMAEMEE